jgi:hypothetical protein
MNKIILIITLIISFSITTFAQITDLSIDKTFGTNGTTFIKADDVDYTHTHIFVYPSTQEMLSAGYYDETAGERGLFFTKYLANGKVDTTFADGGKLILSENEYAFNSVLRIRQAVDNSFLILLGNSDVHNSDTTGILCFTSTGKIVYDFGNGGILSAYEKGQILDFDIQSDAKILTLNSAIDTVTNEVASSFTRFSQLGLLDTSYGTNGSIEIIKDLAQYVRMDKKGQDYILTGDMIDIATVSLLPAMIKVSVSGIQNTTFGTGGIAIGAVTPTGELAYPTNVQFLKDGTFLLNGYFENEVTKDYTNFLTKYDANGKAITTFGDNGYIVLDEVLIPEIYYSLSVHELSNTDLLVTKTSADDDDILEIEARMFKANGTPRTTFGVDGELRIKLDDNETTVFASALTADSKLIMAGDMTNPTTEFYEAAITRFKLDGLSAISEPSALSHTSLSPNPVKEIATLSYELAKNANVSLQLFDIEGRMVQQFMPTQNRTAGKQNETLQFNTALPTGQYLLKIDMAEKGIKTFKVNKL